MGSNKVIVGSPLPTGNNNIGDVDVATLPALVAGTANIGDVDVLTVPAPLSTTGNGTAAAAHRVTLASDSTGQVAIASIAAGTTNIGDVDVLTVPAPLSTTGNGTAATAHRVTLASDSTGQVAIASIAAGTTNIGDVDVLTVPADPFGATADASVAAGATGSISAKLRRATQGLEDLKTLIVLGAGTNNIGDVDVLTLPVVNPIVRIQVTPTVSTSPAYTAKDAVGALLTFANAARVSGGGITIQSVTVVDLSQQMPALDLVLFDRTFTAPTDNAVFDPTDAELATCVGVIPISNWADFNDNSVAARYGLGLAVTLNGTSLFGALVTRSTPTFVGTSDIVVTVGVEQA